MKHDEPYVSVSKNISVSDRPSNFSMMYDIEFEDNSLVNVTEEAAKFIYRELGRLLSLQEGGQS